MNYQNIDNINEWINSNQGGLFSKLKSKTIFHGFLLDILQYCPIINKKKYLLLPE